MTHPPAPSRRPARHRVLVLAAALPLAVAAVPVALAVAGDDGPTPAPRSAAKPQRTPDASSAPTAKPPERGSWRTTIPAHLPLAHALPRSEVDDVGTVDEVAFCDVPALRPDGVVDRRTAGAAGPEYGELRDLRVFADDRAAHRHLVRFVEAVSACPAQRTGGTTWRHVLRPTRLPGDEGVTGVQTFEQDGLVVLGANWWEVVRVGNAVLVTATGGEWMPGPALRKAIRQHARDVDPVVAAMCTFAATGCGSDIPQGFPLAAGWPDEHRVEPGGDHGLRGPGRALPPLTLSACGAELGAADHLDRFTASWTNVEDYRGRELTTYADADAAVARVAEVRAFFEACPRGPRQCGYVSVTEVRRTRVGGESWAVVVRQERAGAPAVGLQVVHVIRFGRAVLVDTAANEAGAGPDHEADVRRQVREQTRGTADVVAAMCAFSETGCDD